jgi:flagellar P-ring protein FlgI
MKTTRFIPLALFLLLAPLCPGAVRLKELVSIEGVRDNQLVGYGLVVGLAGSGDRRQTLFSAQSLANMLQRMGLTVPAGAIQVKNTAAVMLTATLPPYSRPGARIDVTASAMGDASSLQGGVLLMAGLKAADGNVYAVAQGPVALGGFVAGSAGNAQAVNHSTVARIPSGAIVERPAPSVRLGNQLQLQLHRADFTTASRVAGVLNKQFGNVARTGDAALVTVTVPQKYAESPAEFVAELEKLTVDTDREVRIVVNERTGTIVMGKDVRIAPVAIIQGNLTVEIQTTLNVSQPGPLSQGSTQVTPQVAVQAKEEKARNLLLKDGATIEELVRALSSIGSTPREIISILQNLKSVGALEANLEVI